MLQQLNGSRQPGEPGAGGSDGWEGFAKALRSSFDKALGQGAIHMVSAWASANRLVLGQ